MQNIVTLGEINDALKLTSVTAAQLADMGFAPLDNKPICEALPTEQSRRLRNAKLYPADSIGKIRATLAHCLAAPAACLHQIQEPAAAAAEQAAWHAGIDEGRAQTAVSQQLTTEQQPAAYPNLPAKQALYVFQEDGKRAEIHGYDVLDMWGYVDADRAQRAAPVLAAQPSSVSNADGEAPAAQAAQGGEA